MTRLVISGSRGIISEKAYDKLCEMINTVEKTFGPVSEVVHGCCPNGVDVLAEMYIKENRRDFKHFPADWSRGKVAGMQRNRKMAQYADVGIMIWDGESPGTRNMINEMSELEKPYYVCYWKESDGK
jgi:hypothetical protein